MTASIHSREYRCVLAKLIGMRKTMGLTQRDLAKLLQRENSFVWRIETGKRRLDLVEFYWVCKALRQNAAAVYRDILQEINTLESPPFKKSKAGAARQSPRQNKCS